MNRDDALLADWRRRALAMESEVAKAIIVMRNREDAEWIETMPC